MQLSDFKTYVKYDFKRTDKDTELVQAYNDMINWLSLQLPLGNYKFQSYAPTVARQEDYPIPSNAIHIIHPIRLLIGSGPSDSGYQLTHLSKDEYDLLEPNPNRNTPPVSRPTGYTIFSRSILLTPVPDSSSYLLEINWSKRVTALSADSDLSSLGSEWDEVLKQGTLERLYAGMGMIEEANFWGGKYHILGPSGDDIPVGLCKKLIDNEKDREESAIGSIKTNSL